MERLFISKYNEKIKKIKIDEIELSRNDDSLTKEIYNIAINELPNNIGNFSEEEMDEKIEFNKAPLEILLSSSINTNCISMRSSLRQSNASSNSDKTSASSELESKFNDNINVLEIVDNNYIQNNDKKRKIDITHIITGEDKRTMIEINKIPKKFNIKIIKAELNNKGFKDKYDYLSMEIIDRYNNDINFNSNCKKIFINFVHPLHIIIFYKLYQKKYFSFKGNINNIQYSDAIPKRNIFLEPNYNLKKSCTSNYMPQISKIEIPKEYFDFYKKINPNDVCINLTDSFFRIETFIIKKKNHKK